MKSQEILVKQVADPKGKGKATPSATPKASNSLRREPQSSWSGRRQKVPLEVGEMERETTSGSTLRGKKCGNPGGVCHVI